MLQALKYTSERPLQGAGNHLLRHRVLTKTNYRCTKRSFNVTITVHCMYPVAPA
jgi:hypothetical protein